MYLPLLQAYLSLKILICGLHTQIFSHQKWLHGMFIHMMCENCELFQSADPEVLLNTVFSRKLRFYTCCSVDVVFFHHEFTSLLVLFRLYISYTIATVDSKIFRQKTKKRSPILLFIFNGTPRTLNLYVSRLENGLTGMKRWQQSHRTDAVTSVTAEGESLTTKCISIPGSFRLGEYSINILMLSFEQ